MMPNLNQIYDRAFFEEWGRHHETYISSARLIVQTLVDLYQPKRLIDVGCGCGVYSAAFKEKGVDVVSLDGVQPPQEEAFPVSIYVQDLTVPFKNPWEKFDVALCLEVAEHIPETFVSAFLDNLLQFSDFLLLSAAPPNQGGHHHVNEQPKRYWVQKLAEKQFVYDRKKTGVLVETLKKSNLGYKWMGEHISVYERAKKDVDFKRDLPFSTSLQTQT